MKICCGICGCILVTLKSRIDINPLHDLIKDSKNWKFGVGDEWGFLKPVAFW